MIVSIRCVGRAMLGWPDPPAWIDAYHTVWASENRHRKCHMIPLRLLVLGLPEVYLGERAIKLPTRKSLALLVYLAVQGGTQSREHLTALLWPDQEPSR